MQRDSSHGRTIACVACESIWGLTLARRLDPLGHAMRWIHCGLTAAMHGPKVPCLANVVGVPVKAQRTARWVSDSA